MKLTTQHSMRDFTQAVGTAALHSSIDAVAHHSYAAACGSLEHLIYQICQRHPAALMVVNDYLTRNTPVTPAKASPALRAQMEERARQHLNAALALQAPRPQEGRAEPSDASAPASQKSSLWDDADFLPPPTAKNLEDTSPDATHVEASAPHAPASAETQTSETDPGQPVHTHAATEPPEATAQQTPTTTTGAHALPQGSPAASSSRSSSNGSSAHHGDACGDINCDGRCDDRAPLIILIDQCASVDAARREVANATPAALRNAARYLRTDRHSLTSVITRRVRERLLKAA